MHCLHLRVVQNNNNWFSPWIFKSKWLKLNVKRKITVKTPMYMGNSHNTIMIYDDISLIQKSLEKLSMNFEKKILFCVWRTTVWKAEISFVNVTCIQKKKKTYLRDSSIIL